MVTKPYLISLMHDHGLFKSYLQFIYTRD